MLPPELPDRMHLALDDHHLAANAGLLLPATLAHRQGLGTLVDRHVIWERPAAAVVRSTRLPEQTPAITEYGGTILRSRLEARWAAYFDRQGIAWEYEPARLDA